MNQKRAQQSTPTPYNCENKCGRYKVNSDYDTPVRCWRRKKTKSTA